MTELSPLGTFGKLTASMVGDGLTKDEIITAKVSLPVTLYAIYIGLYCFVLLSRQISDYLCSACFYHCTIRDVLSVHDCGTVYVDCEAVANDNIV